MTMENTKQQESPPSPPAAGSVLPCPFCGSEAKIFTRKVHDNPESPHRLYWYVCNCYTCGVGVTHGEWTERAARVKWNRRVPPNSPAAPSGVVCSEIVSCPKCNSTKCVRLWRVEVVLPGDNSDNSTKGWRWGCLNCGADWLERITANAGTQRPGTQDAMIANPDALPGSLK